MRYAVLALLVAACGSNTPAADTTTTTTPPTSSTNKPAQTGPLSETEFKAMHAAPEGKPAPGRGQRIDLGGGKAYLSLPEGKGPFPGIVVIHEWWGLNGHIEQWTDRLASAGWAAIAVDLYNGNVATTSDEAMKAVKAVKPAEASATIAAAIDFLAKDPRIAAPKRAVIGWCFGGAWSLQAALANPELDGAIIYYGQLETDPAALVKIKAELLGIFANRDRGIPPDVVNKFEAALETANVRHTIFRYDAEHAFANPSNPKYDESSAADAWSHVLAFLDKLKKSS